VIARRVLVPLILTLVVAYPAAVLADGDESRWGITIWGVSYHVDKAVDYNEGNWGLGLQYYVKPRRLFLELDALRNSNRGLVLPASIGAELGIGTLPGGCRLAAVGAFTVAYYENQHKDTTEIKFGPVPGVTLGCRHVKVNVMAILKSSKPVLAAMVASLTIPF
jgi:hypothetical protein